MDPDVSGSFRAEMEYFRDDLRCCVPSCLKYRRDYPNTPFLSIPKSLKANWCRALERHCPKRNLHVCGDHINIEEDCYKIKSGRLRLKKSANLILTKTFHEIRKLQEAVPHEGRQDLRLDSQPHISASTASQLESDPAPFNQENQDTIRENTVIFKTEFNQEEENFIHENQDTNQDDINIFKTCCFCNTHDEDCIEITDSKPYVTSNRTKITFNDMSIEINEDTTLKLVCQNCDSKLVEMYEFVKLVSEAQNRLTNDDLNTNFETKTEEATSCCSDEDSDEDTFSLSNSTVEDESIRDTESIEQTTIGRKRIGEKEDLIIIKKCRNNDYNNDPLSFNDEFKCKEEVDDKELVKDAILANTVTGASKDFGEDNDITVKKEYTDEGQLNERKNIDKNILIIDIKEESKETGDENDYTEIPQHEKGIEVELTELYQDEEFS